LGHQLFDVSDTSLRAMRIWMAMIFGVGLFVRIGLLLITSHGPMYGEGSNIARSLVNNGTYSDAYGPGVGPTAHTPPALPIILAIIIRIAGPGPGGYFVASALASMMAAASFALLPLLALKCDLGTSPGIIAGLIGAVAPISFWAQTAGINEAPYTMLGVTALCVIVSGFWVREYFPVRGGISLGVLSGILSLFAPTIIQILFGWSIVGIIRFKNHRATFLRFMSIAALLIMIFLSPWAFRNFKTFGRVIWTRSNLGLELQLSNNDHTTADLEQNVRSADFPHPYTNLTEREKVRQMGELAYQESKKKEALAWIYTNPKKFIQLTLRRMFLFWFPPMQRWWQSIAEALMTILGIAGIFSLFKKDHPSSWMFLAVLLFYPAIYLVVQVSPRYRLPIEPILLLLSCFFCTELPNALKGHCHIRLRTLNSVGS
jgi:hypothetical protein